MKSKHVFFVLLFTTIFSNLFCQKITLDINAGYGTYSMSQIKESMKDIMVTNYFDPKQVENFPGYVYFRPNIAVNFNFFNVGASYTLMSTGSRYSLHDYSGDYKFDTQIIGNAAGLFVEFPFYTLNKFQLYIATEGGIVFNKMKLEETLQLYDLYNNVYNETFLSKNFFIKPYFKLEYKFRKNISSNINIGFHKDINENKMYFKANKSRKTDFVANWDGLRASIGISYSFN